MSNTDNLNKTSNNSRIINLTSADSELLVNEAIAEINFKAPLETGTAATTNCAQIQAKRENKSHAKLIGGDWTYDHTGGASERLWTTSVAHTLSAGDQIVFSGIGNHQTFVSMLREYKLNILKDIEFPDHYKYNKYDINKIQELSNNLNCQVLTTEKDYLRLDKDKIHNINFIRSELKILDEEKLMSTILQ